VSGIGLPKNLSTVKVSYIRVILEKLKSARGILKIVDNFFKKGWYVKFIYATTTFCESTFFCP